MTKDTLGEREKAVKSVPIRRMLDWGNPKGLAWAAIIIPAVLGFIPLWQTFSQNRMGLTVERLASTPLVNAALPSRVAVLVDGTPAEQVWVSALRVRNSGKRPIEADRFAEGTNLDIEFGTACRVLEATIEGQSPGLRPKDIQLQAKGAGVAVAPLLLNAGDWFDARVLTAGCRPVILPSARIRDIAQVKLVTRQPEATTYWALALEILSVICFVSAMRLYSRHLNAVGRPVSAVRKTFWALYGAFFFMTLALVFK